jgi:chromosome segregation ATPase
MSESESKPFFCETCDKECGNESNLKGHLASRNHREKIDALIAEDTERLSAAKLELATVEQSVSGLRAVEQSFSVKVDGLNEEIDSNEAVLKEQSEQIQKNVTELSVQKPELERLEALRSERKTLEQVVEGLKAEKSQLFAQLTTLTDDIQKTVALRPELEEEARNQIITQLVKEEEAKLNADRLERLRNQNDYHTGVISLDEYTRREKARVAKK